MNRTSSLHSFCEAGIAIGSNFGNRFQHTYFAIDFLKSLSAQNWIQIAPLYETEPINCPPNSPLFLNTIALIHPLDSPENLLIRLRKFEQQQGRPTNYERNAPRPLDLDILYFGEKKMESSFLTLPHPRLHLRRFVLQPLCDLRPDLILPGFEQTVKTLLSQLKSCETPRRVEDYS